ncbi:hypothetical protein CCACVL1_08503 [Corchorus capsularis]|uniref:Uncharacterized protein n=1 Tax=Corchorus capsularis TaxID=210143 RepID=A0A1R3J0E2_COCAP|nr:hypothetical protein CCACVL1_08503 [Corchorus capsularis]
MTRALITSEARNERRSRTNGINFRTVHHFVNLITPALAFSSGRPSGKTI